MKDDHRRAAFQVFTRRLHGKPVENQCVASY
jgi:hypothetical protein